MTAKNKTKPSKRQVCYVDVPGGYVLRREPKSAKIQLLVRESTKKELQQAAKKEKTSVNNLINNILEDFLYRGRN